ncbi:MAG: long-chain-acyl-CoA synthetase [Myxococcales bacterium]|nr:long-chain-acyl-CoA synthetase [Myxococcales bacterium]
MTRTVVRSLRMKPLPEDAEMSLGQLVAENAARFPGRPFLSCEGEQLTWRNFNTRANRYAHRLRQAGVGKGDHVALMLENRVEFLTALIGICKLGAAVGLINTNQRRDVLRHSVNLIGAKQFIFGEECRAAVEEVRAELDLPDGAYLFVPDRRAGDTGGDEPPPWAERFHSEVEAGPDFDPPETAGVQQRDPCFLVFTSGTTGMPKAAVVRNERLFRAMQGYGRVCLDVAPSDKLYNCLPLYHSTGLIVGFGSIAYGGASMFLRRRFSASRFVNETREEGTNLFIYVGELCRYLVSQPEKADDARNPLTKSIGNGLRPDIWMDFKRRFGISHVYELYGASEGNAGFVNAFNKDSTIGFGLTPHVLAQYDVDADELVRDDAGRCVPVQKGEAGLLLTEISDKARFDGYTDADASEKKIVRGVVESGDAYFNTGDLVREVDVGFAFRKTHYQFVDRTGDTFRWKGENCSTNEVAEVLNGAPNVATANVFGVLLPGCDGRAGMAALTLDGDAPELGRVDWEAFHRYVAERLPAYARPVFLRITKEQPSTETFKLQKTKLRHEAYHPDRTAGDPILVLLPGESAYRPLSEETYRAIEAGEAGF